MDEPAVNTDVCSSQDNYNEWKSKATIFLSCPKAMTQSKGFQQASKAKPNTTVNTLQLL